MMTIFLLLISHFIGDFTLQPTYLVNKKNEKFKYLIVHAVIYGFMIFLVLLCTAETWGIVLWSSIILISHLLIDYSRIQLNKKMKNHRFSFFGFIIDQSLHIVILIIIAFFIGNDFNVIGETIILKPYNNLTSIDLLYMLKRMLCFIIILSPSSVFIKYFFNYLFGENDVCMDGNNNIGSVIGKLERLVMLILGMMGLYTSIAIVLTAKSIARFKQLEDRDFAEKYLIGTLISLLMSIGCLWIIKM